MDRTNGDLFLVGELLQFLVDVIWKTDCRTGHLILASFGCLICATHGQISLCITIHHGDANGKSAPVDSRLAQRP